VRRVVGRLGDGRRVHHRLCLPDDREGVARVGEVRLHVLRLPWLGALEDGGMRSVARTSWPASTSAATAARPTLPRAPVATHD
jgi:hypothetical protein